ncbi:DNA invertase Pin-like site-specific DNA recombinase [Pseudoclavibacter helvolus]|uniref:DNA invertase Pin-like site-specific DNA recombinase n=1 Tax=Pseudoclavibacter helvolus TaxID=255205 RepID=A0A7W4UM59_9MICO|nr:DNA invertase Pin-like site-specific DNA recombinase [Pseudoclavibacter helvolus]
MAELDEGTASAYLPGVARPQFVELTRLVQTGSVDVVVAADQTRLTRTDAERAAFMKLCSDAGVQWHFSSTGVRHDLRNPSDALHSTVMGAFAAYESDLKRMRLAARFAARRADKLPLWGPRPFGFELDRVTLDETEAAELRKAYAAIVAGKTLTSVVRDWERRGIRTPLAQGKNPKRPPKRPGGNAYTVTTLKALLLRVRNVGVLEYEENGETKRIEGAWQPIVSADTFRRAHARLTNPDRKLKGGTTKRYLSAGLALCACGLVLRSGNGNGEAYLKCRPSYERRDPVAAASKVHSSIPMRLAEPFVMGALVRAICEAPMPDDAGELTGRELAVEDELIEARATVEALLDMLDAAGAVASQVQARIAAQGKRVEKLEAERDELAARRHGSLKDLRAEWYKRDPATGKTVVDWSGAATLADAVRAKLDSLSVKDQTELAREYVVVRLAPGRGKDRLSVEYLKSPQLNSEEMDAAELADAAFEADEERRIRRAASIHRLVVGYADALPSRVTFLPSGRVSKTAPPAQSQNS